MGQEQEIIRGIVKKVEPVWEMLTFITIDELHDDKNITHRVPFYGKIVPLDLIFLVPNSLITLKTTKSRGWFTQEFKQEIYAKNYSATWIVSQSFVDNVNKLYREKKL